MGIEGGAGIIIFLTIILYCGVLASAAIIDMVVYRIPNILVVALCVTFAVAASMTATDMGVWFWHVVGLLTAFAVGVFAWRVRLMGGGDVKLISALGLWTGPDELPGLILMVALVGGVVTALLVVVRYGAHRYGLQRKHLPTVLRRGEPVPYGVAIASGGLLMMPELPILSAFFQGS